MAGTSITNWTKPMTQYFEYYIVNPDTWEIDRKLTTVQDAIINRDLTSQLLSTMTMKIDEDLNEDYVRVFLVTDQNGIEERTCLGTFLVTAPTMSFDGMASTYSIDAYSPLIELREKSPNIGYYTLKNENILNVAYHLASENCRAPVIQGTNSKKLFSDYVANEDDTWLSYISDLLSNAKYRVSLDEIGRVSFKPIRDFDAISPVWTFNDDNSSILMPKIESRQDLYGIPNVVEVIASNSSGVIKEIAENNDAKSPTSIKNRKRRITQKIVNPSDIGDLTRESVKEYANKKLLDYSTIECTLEFEHGYCPVTVGDCVLINYTKAGIINQKAQITYQSISCQPGCTITETVVFPLKLWNYA